MTKWMCTWMGAAACVVLAAGCSGPATDVADVAEPDVYLDLIETLCHPSMEGRDAGTDGIDLARDLLVKRFILAGLQPAFEIDGELSYVQSFELRVSQDEQGLVSYDTVENVGALLPGVGELADEIVVVGAHYDHIGYGYYGSRARERAGELHPGADDNASGTAGVVMLADYFAAQAAATPPDARQPRRSILFTCFAGEERGLLGSRYMVANPQQWAFDGKDVVAMVNMDMIGRMEDGELFIFTDDTAPRWRPWINQENQGVDLNLVWDVRPPGGSDHTSFIRAGIPAIFFNTWLHPDYHTPDDTPDRLNPDGSVRVLSLAAEVLDRAATEPQRLQFVKPVRRPRSYIGASIGEGDRGLTINRLSDDGPLKLAGAQVDDVVLFIDGIHMHDVYHFRRWLLTTDPGSPARFVLQRGAERIKLRLVTGKR